MTDNWIKLLLLFASWRRDQHIRLQTCGYLLRYCVNLCTALMMKMSGSPLAIGSSTKFPSKN